MVRSLVVLSEVLLAAACFLLDHQTRPASTAKRTTAMRSPLGFTTLSPLPPGDHAEGHDAEREKHDAEPEEHVDFLRAHVEGAVFGRFRPDRDEVLVGGEPVDHVEEQIAVAV